MRFGFSEEMNTPEHMLNAVKFIEEVRGLGVEGITNLSVQTEEDNLYDLAHDPYRAVDPEAFASSMRAGNRSPDEVDVIVTFMGSVISGKKLKSELESLLTSRGEMSYWNHEDDSDGGIAVCKFR